MVKNSIAVENLEPATGGRGVESIEEIRQNASVNFATQLRNVTQDDYLVRALSMPAKYGNIAKAYIEPTKAQSIASGEPYSILDLYILTYNNNRKLNLASTALKQNLITYLSQYRMVNDAINIKDAFIINIGVNFDIVVASGYNNNDVITNCIIALQNHFSIDKWNINQPIVLSDITSVLLQIKGVQNVIKVEIVNKQDPTGVTYSQYGYDIAGATKNGHIYPSVDPAIFEVRYPNTDIQGRVVVY